MIEQYAFEITALLIFICGVCACLFIQLAFEWVCSKGFFKKF